MDMLTAGNPLRKVTIAGVEFKARNRTFQEWATFQAWLADHVPGPLHRALVQLRQMQRSGIRVPPQERAEVLSLAAKQAWPPGMLSSEWYEALEQPGVMEEFLAFALGDDNPGLTRPRLADLRPRLTVPELVVLTTTVYGIIPPPAKGVDLAEDAAEDDGDPKAPIPDGGGPSSSTSATARAGATTSSAA